MELTNKVEKGGKTMKHVVMTPGAKCVLNTDRDRCLYTAPRNPEPGQGAYKRGKDMYFHRTGREQGLYYLHKWTIYPGETESITVIPDRQAERFLGERGLDCQDLPGVKAYLTLRNWGYGIMEEF
jgi:hypothetical protein